METLSTLEDFKPFFIGAMPKTLELLAWVVDGLVDGWDYVVQAVVDAVAAITDPILGPLKKAKTVINYSLIATGAFGVWWFLLRKK